MTRARGFAFLLLLAITAVSPIYGQASTPGAALEFEVATVRQNKSTPDQPRFPGDGQGTLLPGGQLTMRNQVLKTLLGFAFNPGNQRFRDDLIVGLPITVTVIGPHRQARR